MISQRIAADKVTQEVKGTTIEAYAELSGKTTEFRLQMEERWPLYILKCYDLVKLKICEVMYHAFNKTLPVNLNNVFTVCEPNCLFNMRKKIFLHKYTRTNLKAMSVSVVGAELWNELDSNLRNTKTILLFKKNQMGCTTHVCITCLSIFVLKNVVRR